MVLRKTSSGRTVARRAQDVKPARHHGIGRQYDDASSDVINDVCRTQDDGTMPSAWTQDDDVSNDAGPDVGWKFDGRKLNGRPTKVGRKSNVGRVDLSHRCGDGGRWRYTAAPRNAAAMAGSVAARSVVAALAGNALQLVAFFRHCCNNALDLAALLRWPTARWTSRRCCDGR